MSAQASSVASSGAAVAAPLGPYLRGWLLFTGFVGLEVLPYLSIAARRLYGPGVEYLRRASWAPGFVLFHLPIYLAFGAPVFFGARLGEYLRGADRLNQGRPWRRFALAHIACVALLVLASWAFPPDLVLGHIPARPWALPAPTLSLYGLMLLLIWIAVAMWLLAMAPAAALARFIAGNWAALLGLFAGALTYVVSRAASDTVENWLHHILFTPTVSIAAWLLRLVGYHIVVNPAAALIGDSRFLAEIGPSCLGYEGVLLLLLLLGAYLAAFRRRLIFPNALFLPPLAALTIWLFNALRIALLIAVGSSWSPAIASHGFHSGLGAIFLVLVAGSSIYLLERAPIFSRQSRDERAAAAVPRSDEALPLAPQLVLTAVAMVTLLGTSGFDWPYPLRVLSVGGVLILMRGRFRFGRFELDTVALGIGAAVFALWLMLAPDRPAETARFAGALATAPWPLAFGWLLFRCLGAVVTVPLAEEMAFRGFLLPFIAKDCGILFGARLNLAIAALVSSLAFGFLHRDWIAGCAAGLAYAVVRLRRDRLADAVVAHATTNLLLAVYVLVSRRWSYW
jgi:exosortase E/protease (VPEID-CTERM system)